MTDPAQAVPEPVTGDEDESPYNISYVLTPSLEYGDQLPKTLWHYTSGAGVTGILTTRQLWGTNCLYLNDLREFRYAGDVINLALTDVINEDTTPEVRGELQRLQGLIASAHPTVTPAIYICSLSARHDHLNLWTRYTKAGDAYSVGIDGMYLWLRGYQSWQLRRCFYDPKEQRVMFHYAISDRLEELKKHDRLPRAIVELAYDFAWLAPLVKDPCWEDEHEWRFIRYPRELVRFPEPDPPVIHMRPSELGDTPYTPFSLDGSPLSLRITIGPGPTPRLSENDLVEMGAKSGVVVRPELSKRPIRSW
jgi:hypothetical protein